MAESLLKYVTKRRNRSSDSSTDGKVDSPAMKKVKSTSDPESSPPRDEHGEHNEDRDLVLTALELTDDLSGTLKCILEKLKKLDTIEYAVKKIEGSLDKLEERTAKLEELEKTAREDIDNLKTNHMLIEKKQDDAKKALDKKIKGIEGKIAELKVKEREIDQTLKDLNTKDLYLEAYSRRENIKFNNIPESPSPRNGLEDTEEVLRSFLESSWAIMMQVLLTFKEFTDWGERKKMGECGQFLPDSFASKIARKFSLLAPVSEIRTSRCLRISLKNW